VSAGFTDPVSGYDSAANARRLASSVPGPVLPWFMVRLRVAVVAVVASTGCDDVFDLTYVAPPDAAIGSVCPYVVTMPDADRDNDGIPDAIDPCPLVPNHDPHDEDGDGIPDVCDPCPHLAVVSEDADCDMIGAACDPDDTVPHRQWFHAFHNANGLALFKSTVAGGQLRLPLQNEHYGEAFALPTVRANGTYEIAGTLSGLDQSYMEMSLIFAPELELGEAPYYEVTLRNDVMGVFAIDRADQDLASIRLGGLPSTVQFHIAATITDTTLEASLSGFTTARLTAAIPTLTDFLYGVDLYRYDTGSGLDLRVDYLRRVAPIAD
jgi:hypothetical protein